MKKFCFLFVLGGFFFCSMNVNAQLLEVKVNPLGALFQSPDVSVEYIMSDNFGLEGKVGYTWRKTTSAFTAGESKSNGFALAVLGKYYFNPDEGADRFYTGLYGKFRLSNSNNEGDFGFPDYRNTALAVGIVGGFKWVGDNGILLDINLGLGRALLNNIEFTDGTVDPALEEVLKLGDFDGISTIALGYRLGGK